MSNWLHNKPASRQWSKIQLWIFVAFATLFTIVGWAVVRETLAYRTLTTTIAQLRAAGIPTIEAMAAQLDGATHREGSLAWAEVLELATNSWSRQLGANLPYIGSGEIPELTPEASLGWKDKDEVEAYLTQCSPVLETLHSLSSFPAPVWLPLESQGISTPLTYHNNISYANNMLLLDAELALHQRGASRAIRDIQSSLALADAFDWDLLLSTKHASNWTRARTYSMIRRSLQIGLWDEEQLSQLRALVEESATEIESTLPALMKNQLAIQLPLLESGMPWHDNHHNVLFRKLAGLPSVRLSVLEELSSWASLPAAGLNIIVANAERISQENALGWRLNTYSLELDQWYRTILLNFLMTEENRRYTLSAIAVKQYHLKNGQWPEHLEQLESLGLAPDDWLTSWDQKFGYEVEDGVAYLWTYRIPLNPGQVATPDRTIPDIRPDYSSQPNKELFPESTIAIR